MGDPDGERDHGRHRRDRRDDPHGADRHAAVERSETDAAAQARCGRRDVAALGGSPPAARPRSDPHPPRCEIASTVSTCSVRDFRPPRKSPSAPRDARAEREDDRASRSVADGPRGGDGVELVRVVEDGRLGRPGGVAVVMRRDRVQELGPRRRVEAVRSLLDQPQAEMHVAEQPALLGRPKRGAARARAPGRGRAAAPRRAAGPRGAAGGAARSRARASRRRPCARGGRPRRSGALRRRQPRSAAAARSPRSAARPRRAPSARSPPARNSRNPSSSSASRRSRGVSAAGSSSAASTERTSSWSRSPKRATRPRTRTASPSAKRVSSSSTSFQIRASIRPVGSTSSSARYAAPFVVRPLLARDRVDALDDPVLRQLGDRAQRGV